MSDADEMRNRAETEAYEVLTYFHNLDAIGGFCGEATIEQKRVFLTMSLVNFARREKLREPETEADG